MLSERGKAFVSSKLIFARREQAARRAERKRLAQLEQGMDVIRKRGHIVIGADAEITTADRREIRRLQETVRRR